MGIENLNSGRGSEHTDHNLAIVRGAARGGSARLPSHRGMGLGLLRASALGADTSSEQAARESDFAEHLGIDADPMLV